jgi:DNA (cytosine-5)-methyltransferase 1
LFVTEEATIVHWQQGGGEVEDQTSGALRANAEHNYQFLRQGVGVRRLTPRECERLQGFPDDYTLIPWRKKSAEDCPDGPRYKALGNSMACNCMAWIGERIAKWEADHA